MIFLGTPWESGGSLSLVTHFLRAEGRFAAVEMHKLRLAFCCELEVVGLVTCTGYQRSAAWMHDNAPLSRIN